MEDTNRPSKLCIMTVSWMLLVAMAPMAMGGGDEAPALQEETGVIEDAVIIGFEDRVPPGIGDWIEDHGGHVDHVDETLSWVSASFPTADEAEQVLSVVDERWDIRYAENDGYAHALQLPNVEPTEEPNDPQYDSQWGYPAINAPEAWAVTQSSHDVSVAILDTGLDTDHEDIAANACGPFESFVPGEPTIWDGYGHGTHVAGTVAAESDNDIGVAGTSQSCLMAGKVLSQFGYGQWSWIAQGITWAADNGADVISMSLGGGSGSSLVEDAVNYAYEEQDVLVVSAAGNSGFWGCDTVGYPAAYEASMAIAAADPPGTTIAGFSSCGDEVDIAAPGSSVLSTFPDDSYRSWAGTSMATPHVSGVAALFMAEHPEMTASEVRCWLTVTADDIEEEGWDQYAGYGMVDAYGAITLSPLAPLSDDPGSATSTGEALTECLQI